MFRRSFAGEGGSGGIWAILLGSIMAIIQFFLGYLVSPGGFGLSRWLFGFIDLVSLPVLIPLIIYTVLLFFRGSSGHPDYANFALLWLIPVAALRTISWSSGSDPILLVIVPLLWTALAVGISFCITILMSGFRWYLALLLIPCMLVLPAVAAGAYWAFFSQQALLGLLLFAAAHIPAAVSLAVDFKRG
jgi:hypothetical protein